MKIITVIGSAVSGGGLVNVYRGTGYVLPSSAAKTSNLPAATGTGFWYFSD